MLQRPVDCQHHGLYIAASGLDLIPQLLNSPQSYVVDDKIVVL
jgi:hypothetical protein